MNGVAAQRIRAFDKDLAVFLSKAMHPKPEERFQDASAFSDALWELGGAMGRLQERSALDDRQAEGRRVDRRGRCGAARRGSPR